MSYDNVENWRSNGGVAGDSRGYVHQRCPSCLKCVPGCICAPKDSCMDLFCGKRGQTSGTATCKDCGIDYVWSVNKDQLPLDIKHDCKGRKVAKFEKFLPKARPVAKVIKGVNIRPDEEVCRFLVRKAELHATSVNMICVAILRAAMEEDKQEIL